MTDREIIIDNFVEKYFMISDNPNNLGTSTAFGVRPIDNDGTFTEFTTVDGFITFVLSLYSNFITDEGISVGAMVQEWFYKQYNEMYGRIYAYLNSNIKISLGPRSWLVEKNGESWNWKDLYETFGGHYNMKTIKIIYTSWYDNRVLEISEQHMNEPFY
jgi:hypothetical protein